MTDPLGEGCPRCETLRSEKLALMRSLAEATRQAELLEQTNRLITRRSLSNMQSHAEPFIELLRRTLPYLEQSAPDLHDQIKEAIT